MRRLALIDADILRYQFGAIERPHPFVKGVFIPASEDFITKKVEDTIQRCKEVTGAEEVRCFFTGSNNFRFDIAKQQPYKGNRIGTTKPSGFAVVGDYIYRKYGSVTSTSNGHEADDELAFHRFEEPDGWERVICSRDKDLNTVPGWHYRWECGKLQPERLPYYMTRFEANKFFLKQCLMGDDTDNIPGCGQKEMVYWGAIPKFKELGINLKVARKLKSIAHDNPDWGNFLEREWGIVKVPRRMGVGPSAADYLLDECDTIGEMLDAVRAQYKNRFDDGTHEDRLLENARLLYMGQTTDNLFDWSWMDGILELHKDSDNE